MQTKFGQSSNRPARRRGGSIMELMLVFPIMLMLSFGVVDYGDYFYLKNTLQGASQSGARAAISTSATNTSVTSVISASLTAAGLSSSQYTVTFSPTDVSTAAAGSTVSVTITATWSNVGTCVLSTYFGGISSSKQILGTATMIKE